MDIRTSAFRVRLEERTSMTVSRTNIVLFRSDTCKRSYQELEV